MRNVPLIVRAQFDAVVSRVPVKPVISMLAIVVAAASGGVPLGLAPRMTLFDATGVHPQDAPPGGLAQSRPVVPPAVGPELDTPLKRIVAQTCLAVPAASVAVMVWAPPGITPW